jgi:hypothetical protein
MRAGQRANEKPIRDAGNHVCEHQREDKVICITTALLPESMVKAQALPACGLF